MKIKPIASNQTELHMDNGTVVLFSYETPVAACLGNGGGFVRANRKYSVTTAKHVNRWLDGRNAREVSPEYLAGLCNHPKPAEYTIPDDRLPKTQPITAIHGDDDNATVEV